MTRVAVIGNAGGGKSTLARQLARSKGLAYHAVDRVQWLPGWRPASASAVRAAQDEWFAAPTWIIDGFGPWDEIERRFADADTIIFIDLPLWRHMWWAAKRQMACLFRPRSDGPEGCPMLPMTRRLFQMMWRIHRDIRPRLMDLVNRHGAGRDVFHIRSVRELDAFRRAHGC